MRRTVRFAAVALLGAVSVVAAHFPEGAIYRAVHFPPGAEPVIDGETDDWAMVPRDEYALTNVNITPFKGIGGWEGGMGSADVSSLNVEYLYGWSDAQNQLYYLHTVFDDIHVTQRTNIDKWYWDDSMESMFHMQHLSEQEVRDLEEEGQQSFFSFNYALPPLNGDFDELGWIRTGLCNSCEWAHPRRATISDYYDIYWSFDGDEFGESTYYYELRTSPYQTRMVTEDNTRSAWTTMDLQENSIVHFTQAIIDVDGSNGVGTPTEGVDIRDGGYWTTNTGGAVGWLGESDLLLEQIDNSIAWDIPTAVEATSWARIKVQMR
jgi:hypothetical protein